MRLYRMRGRVEAEFIKGPFSTSPREDGQEAEFPEGAYHIVENGVARYVEKAEFEKNFEPIKSKGVKPQAEAPATKARGNKKE